jgi:hypothetical protein
LHEVSAEVVDDDGVRHAVADQFPGGEGGALVARTRLINPYMHGDAPIVGQVDRRQGGAPVDGGEPAGVAVGEDVDRPAAAALRPESVDECEAMLADGPIHRNIFIADRCRKLVGRLDPLIFGQSPDGIAHALQRPAEVDGGWSRLREFLLRRDHRGVRGIVAQGQAQPVRCGRADERRAAHDHRSDRHRRFIDGGESRDGEFVGQLRLIDDLHRPAVIGQPDGSIGFAVDVHAWFAIRVRCGRVGRACGSMACPDGQ